MSPVTDKTETIVATLLFLMTRYTREADPSVGKAILHHLALPENHRDTSIQVLQTLVGD